MEERCPMTALPPDRNATGRPAAGKAGGSPQSGALVGTAALATAAGRAPGAARVSRAALSARLGLLAACAVAVYVFEGLLPAPLPWARLGLSNVVVVVALFGYGVPFAFAVNAVRIVAGNLLLGIVMSPAFILSVLGSTAALVVMAAVRWRLVPPLSVVGASVLGAVANNATQVLVFTALLSGPAIAGRLLGIFVLVGLAVGCVTGVVAARVLAKVGLG